MFVGIFAEIGFITDNTERVLHDDSFGFTFTELIVGLAGAKNRLINIVVNRGETGYEDRVNGGNAGIRGSYDFAVAKNVTDGIVKNCHAKTGLEAEMPIFGISIR